jgi:hypothetical protein
MSQARSIRSSACARTGGHRSGLNVTESTPTYTNECCGNYSVCDGDFAEYVNGTGRITDVEFRKILMPASEFGPRRHASRNPALAATCHCGAIRIYVRKISRTLTSCNCSICRRYGALWAYYAASSVTIEAPKGGLSKYSWKRKIRAYYRCKKCGCVTHYAYRRQRRNTIIAVNAVNFEPAVLTGARIRHLGGAASWKFFD